MLVNVAMNVDVFVNYSDGLSLEKSCILNTSWGATAPGVPLLLRCYCSSNIIVAEVPLLLRCHCF